MKFKFFLNLLLQLTRKLIPENGSWLHHSQNAWQTEPIQPLIGKGRHLLVLVQICVTALVMICFRMGFQQAGQWLRMGCHWAAAQLEHVGGRAILTYVYVNAIPLIVNEGMILGTICIASWEVILFYSFHIQWFISNIGIVNHKYHRLVILLLEKIFI